MADRSDDFDRANETPLSGGGNWTIGTGDAGSWNLVSNAAAPSALGSDCSAWFSAQVWLPDQSASVPVVITGTVAGTGPGVCLRRAPAVRTYYRITASKAVTNNINFGRYTNGTFASLVSFTTTWVDGDLLTGTVTGQGAATVLTALKNGVQIGTFTDSTSTILTGAPGIAYSSTATAASLTSWTGSDNARRLLVRMPLGV